MDDLERKKHQDAVAEVCHELILATSNYGKFNTPHEGWAVLFEEVDELWDEVKKKPSVRSKEQMRLEAMQVAAMALRFMIDLCHPEQEVIETHAQV